MKTLKIGEGFGIELEYMIVDAHSLNIKPIADKLIEIEVGEIVNEIENRDIGWSNELALHVIELKNLDPTLEFENYLSYISNEIEIINSHLLKNFSACLMPTSMHPWMNPQTESVLWPHGQQVIYNQYNKLFNCSGHGWTNLQSVHLNYSFEGDDEFYKLHTAIRLVLPLIPVLSASSPIVEGRISKKKDTRLEFYLKNQKKVPEIIGEVIPEYVTNIKEYQETILKPMYKAVSAMDPNGILQHEWLNSRAAIAKFKYGCIEIRLMDIQETPLQDLSLAWFFRKLVGNLITSFDKHLISKYSIDSKKLKFQLEKSIIDGTHTSFNEPDWLSIFGVNKEMINATELISVILDQMIIEDWEKKYLEGVKYILTNGNLSERILTKLNGNTDHKNIKNVYKRLTECLSNGESFE